MGINNQFEIELKKDVESEDGLTIHFKLKVDDVNYAELVFGQAPGTGISGFLLV